MVLTLFAVAGTCGCAWGLEHPEPPTGEPTFEKFEAYVRATIADGDPPSVSIAVSQRDTLVYERAFGYADAPGGVRATPDTSYRWFSVTKPVTAVAVLQLVERGLVSLSEPASTYLPYLAEYYGNDVSAITIERLLSHQSGVGDVGNEIMAWIHVTGHHRQSVLLRDRLGSAVHFDADELDHGHYSNLGYMILGAVIEAVSGETYEDYVVRHILEPLQMNHTRFYYEDAFAPGTVHAVGSHPDDLMAWIASFSIDLDTVARECTQDRWWFRYFSPDQTPPSGLVGTSADMVRLGRMIVGRGVLDGKRVLSEDSVRRMTARQVAVASSPVGAPPGFSFGYAWFVTQDERARSLLLHGGQGMAFTSLLLIRPEDEFVAAIAANGTYVDGANAQRLMAVVAALDWSRPK